jgi:predicted PurR-regulated permease PerM
MAEELTQLWKILSGYGPLGVVLGVLIYIVLKGQLRFEYPRERNKSRDD